MSFLTDLVEGRTSNLGNDLSHAGSSFANHPMEWAETAGVAALGAAPFVLPELLGGAGALGGAAEGGGMFAGMFGGADAAAGVGDAAAAGGLDTSVGLGYGTSTAADTGVIGGAGAPAGAPGGADSFLAGSGVPGAGPGVPGGGLPGGGVISGEGGITPIASGTAVGAPAPSPPPGGGFMDSLSPSNWTLGGVGKVAGVAAAGAGLGMNMLRGNQMDPNQQKLADLAGQLGSQGQVLESYLKTGKLPPALQAQLDQAKASERARVIAGYAQRGQPTDPRLNSALAQELNNIDTNAIAAMAQVQVEMLNTGLKETGMSMQLYETLTKLDMQENQDLMKSIQAMAMALGGGFGGAPAKAA